MTVAVNYRKHCLKEHGGETRDRHIGKLRLAPFWIGKVAGVEGTSAKHSDDDEKGTHEILYVIESRLYIQRINNWEQNTVVYMSARTRDERARNVTQEHHC